jgi:hypothetical protein
MITLFLIVAFILAPFQTPTPPAPTPIRYGDSQMGELSSLRPDALYTFAGQRGDVIVVTMERTAGNIDPLILLTDSVQRNVLAVDNDGGGGQDARLQFVVPEAGNYVIKASAVQTADLAGDFRLTLTALKAAAQPASSPRLNLLQTTQSGTLTDDIPLRLYAVALEQGATLALRLTGQAELIIYSADFAELARKGTLLEMTAPYSGWYWLAVQGMGEVTLDATFPTYKTPFPDAPRLIPGQLQTGNFDQAVGARYAFVAPPNMTIDLTLNGAGFTVLYDANLRELASGSVLRTVKLPAPGIYYLIVIGSGGDYSFTLAGTLDADAPPTAESTPFSNQLVYGDSARGEISEGTPRLFFTFTGRAGDLVIVQALHRAGGTLDPLLYLYQYVDGRPQLIATINDRAPGDVDAVLTDFRLPANSSYLIVVAGANNSSGAFTLSLNRRAN